MALFEKNVPRCSFCQKWQEDVRMLIAGPLVYICDECVDFCADILRRGSSPAGAPDVKDGALAKDSPHVSVSGPAVRCALCRMPTPVDEEY